MINEVLSTLSSSYHHETYTTGATLDPSIYMDREMKTSGSTGVGVFNGAGVQQIDFETQEDDMAKQAGRRIVKVFIVDPDENVPMGKCVLYEEKEKVTDQTDQELYFDLDIKGILTKHNEYRKTLVNKKLTEKVGKEVLCEPVKVRDLSMCVVTVASF